MRDFLSGDRSAVGPLSGQLLEDAHSKPKIGPLCDASQVLESPLCFLVECLTHQEIHLPSFRVSFDLLVPPLPILFCQPPDEFGKLLPGKSLDFRFEFVYLRHGPSSPSWQRPVSTGPDANAGYSFSSVCHPHPLSATPRCAVDWLTLRSNRGLGVARSRSNMPIHHRPQAASASSP